MSIRLRFTLIYTLILALTLALFGAALYAIQAQDTLSSIQQDLRQSANKLAEGALRPDTKPAPPDTGQVRPPIPFDEFSSAQEFRSFPERELGRVLDANGNLVSSPFGRPEDALPLSAEGLQTLQNQKEWWQTATVSDEQMLIYSRPVIVNSQVVYIVQVARSLTERNRSLQSLATTLLIAGLLMVMVAFGIGWFLAGITLRPIQRITQTAKAIGEERDFSRRVDYKGPQDELGQLASTFNSMLARLQDAFRKVEHSLHMQRDFVADVSHELRTPLTTLRGNLGLLRRNPPAPPEEQADILNDMVDESDRLIRLVNDLLLLARADAGRSLAKEPVDISSLLEETCRQAHLLDPERTISEDFPAELMVTGDHDAIKQVLLIVLDNALKHSAGEIKIIANRSGAWCEIHVQDFGDGMSQEKLEHVFDRFYRGEDDATTPGFGLGLPIAKALTEGQNGEITMESNLGQGSTVILRLPAGMGLPSIR
jgi:two-component system, OmpR family, sensor kinase